jgi:hypothetical protein
LPREVVSRILHESARGISLAGIARGLRTTDEIETSDLLSFAGIESRPSL